MEGGTKEVLLLRLPELTLTEALGKGAESLKWEARLFPPWTTFPLLSICINPLPPDGMLGSGMGVLTPGTLFINGATAKPPVCVLRGSITWSRDSI